MRFVALFCLGTGAMLDCSLGSMLVAERTLWTGMWDAALSAGDIVLGDRGFCSFCEFWLLSLRDIAILARLHQRRSVNVRLHKKLGKNDWLVYWVRSGQRPPWLNEELWKNAPTEFLVRHIEFWIEGRPERGKRNKRKKKITLATTLLDPVEWPAEVLIDMYRRRWSCELFLRDIKSTMGMDMLSCKSPSMARKELYMRLIGYNLVRSLMWEAGVDHNADPSRISFKGTMDTLRQWSDRLANCPKKDRKELWIVFIGVIAQQIVPDRPGRNEPRAVKRRPKQYPLLNQPRRQYKEILHRSKYRAAATMS
jgi:hypothetical protein